MSPTPYNPGLRQVQQVVIFGGAAAVAVLAVCLCGGTATAGGERPVVAESGARVEDYSPASDQPYSDPLAGFNDKMFWFNLKLDHYVLRPVAGAYASVAPVLVRRSVGRFFDNVDVLPRVTNSVFQLRFKQAGSETARFAINTTLGGIGLFDVADRWFGLSAKNNDFGLTLRRYHVKAGPYLMLPFFGPSTVTDAIGLGVDAAMDPLSYLVPWYVSLSARSGERVGEAVNYRSLHLNLFEEADLYAIDLYGAVQESYLESRQHQAEDGR